MMGSGCERACATNDVRGNASDRQKQGRAQTPDPQKYGTPTCKRKVKDEAPLQERCGEECGQKDKVK